MRSNFDDQFATLGQRSDSSANGGLGHETTNDAIVFRRGGAVMAVVVAGLGMTMGVIVMIVPGVLFGREGRNVRMGMVMPRAGQRTGPHVANRYDPGNSAAARL